MDVFESTVHWDRRPRVIAVDETDGVPLLGMALLEGCKLTMQVRPGGQVRIEPLAGRERGG
jgi:hypothetical protein